MSTLVLSTGPRRRELTRWTVAALIMLAVHIGVVAALIAQRPSALPPGATLPPILIDLAPISAAPEPPKADLAPGPEMQQADPPATPSEPPPVAQTIVPTPPQPDPVVAVPVEPTPVTRPVTEPAKPKPVHEAV